MTESATWRRTLFTVWVAQFLAMAGFSFVLPFLPFYIRYLGVTDLAAVQKWAGILSAATGLPMAFCAPIWGILADRFGRKVMVLRSMFGGALVLGLMAFARGVGDLLALRILQGVLTGTVSASAALVAGETPKERSGYALGMMHAAVLAGASAGPFLGALTARFMGFRAAFLVAALLLAIGGVLVKCGATEHFRPETAARRRTHGGFRDLLAIGSFTLAVAAILQVHFATTAPAAVLPLFVERLTGQTDAATITTGAMLSATGIVAALAAWKLGRLSDAWGHKRMLVACATLAGIVAIPQALARNVVQLFALRIVLGATAAGILPSANAIIRRSVPADSLGRSYGITASVASVGFALGPLAGGYLSAHFGLRSPFILTGLLLLAVAALVGKFAPSERDADGISGQAEI